MNRAILILATLALLLGGVGQARAGLLTTAEQTQLETWLGEGPLTLTNIFTKTAGDGQTSADFHAAVDGKGRTFTLIEVLPVNGYANQIIGGYDPQSWSSSGGYNITSSDADRTAFLFNLTTTTIERQAIGGYQGQYQTYNYSSYGPTFGGGHDLYVSFDLASGYAFQYSYGSGYNSTNILGHTYTYQGLDIGFGAIEVYTIADAPSAVPESSSLTLFVMATATFSGYFGWWRRSRRRRP
ncbi:MAG TPA: PEP_CTERM-anchored TLD domain-containing protein [Gemmataceae bacterium]|nr:PEP_CTERM-anchored TLD domain-containing protein [Gemmataceae bacterium]